MSEGTVDTRTCTERERERERERDVQVLPAAFALPDDGSNGDGESDMVEPTALLRADDVEDGMSPLPASRALLSSHSSSSAAIMAWKRDCWPRGKYTGGSFFCATTSVTSTYLMDEPVRFAD